ncbi:MAG: metallophosphoesterase, partial [Clostridia bacterium]|nr:metallophosphoesterase [Clostridia bacterium]
MAVMSALSFLAPLMYFAFRFGWVYVDVALFTGFCMTLFWLMVINVVLGLFMDISLLYGPKYKKICFADKKWFSVLIVLHIVLTILFTVIWIVFMIVSGSESIGVGIKFLAEALPLFVLIYGGLSLMIFFPRIAKCKAKAILGGIIAFVMLFGLIFSVFPCYVYKINSHPIVIDNGKDYSIVFSTNDYGTGYVEYVYDGKEYKVYDENNGRLNGNSCIHTINVPYEHLDGNTYRVGSKRVIDELSYGGRTGAERVSEEYKFTSPKGKDEQSYLMISDWHTQIGKAKKAISFAGEYDGVLMLGDSSPGLNFEEEVVRNIVQFGGEITKGEMPIIFARGNHETRGRYAGMLADDLGMDKYYFTVDTGDYTFLVLDSGEDKEDGHAEYGGMVNYEQYRKDMIDWLEKVEIDEGDKVITLVHSMTVAIEEDLQARAYRRLEELNSHYVISGHTHEVGLVESLGKDMITYEDGGFNRNRFVASKITLRQDDVDIKAWDNKGNLVFDNEHKVK